MRDPGLSGEAVDGKGISKLTTVLFPADMMRNWSDMSDALDRCLVH